MQWLIPLAAKSFLFGADAAAFEVEIATNAELGMLEAELQAWRKKGPVGKPHNKRCFYMPHTSTARTLPRLQR